MGPEIHQKIDNLKTNSINFAQRFTVKKNRIYVGLQFERYLTSGSIHRTRQDKRPHKLSVITVKLLFITEFHPHHLDIPGSFPKDPKITGTIKQGLVLCKLKYSLKQEKIWTRSSTNPLQIRRCPDTNTTKRKREKEEKMFVVPGGPPARDSKQERNKNKETNF